MREGRLSLSISPMLLSLPYHLLVEMIEMGKAVGAHSPEISEGFFAALRSGVEERAS
jgi:hypothetical protein